MEPCSHLCLKLVNGLWDDDTSGRAWYTQQTMQTTIKVRKQTPSNVHAGERDQITQKEKTYIK